MLTTEQICEALRPLCKDETTLDMLLKTSMDEYRAIEAAVLAEDAKDREDAERYRWLRDQHWVQPEATFRLGLSESTEDDGALYEKEIAAAIDAARSTTC